MLVTPDTFSFLPELDDEQISRQIGYCLSRGWAVSIEYTDEPHPRDTYWEMFGQPMIDIPDAAGIMKELRACRQTFRQHYIRINAFDSARGRESLRLSFIAGCPECPPGIAPGRTSGPAPDLQHSTRACGTGHPGHVQ